MTWAAGGLDENPSAEVVRAGVPADEQTMPLEVLGVVRASRFHDTSALGVIHDILAMTGPFGPVALAAFVISAIASNSVADTTASYSLIVARLLNGADIGYFVGFFAAGLLYYVTIPARRRVVAAARAES